MTPTEQAEYRNRVARAASKRTGEPIPNGSYDHAAIVIESMFKNANSQVSILTDNLNARVYGRPEILSEARLFLAQGDHSARILLETKDDTMFQDHPFFELLGHNLNIEARYVHPEQKPLYAYNFLVMDKDSYRFEPSRDEPVAVASFGDVDGTANLAKIFEVIWNSGTPIDLPTKCAPKSVSISAAV